MLDIGPIHRKEYEISGRSGNRARSASGGNSGGGIESVVIAEAPGRIHLLGEHGEPGAGLYLSAAIDRSMRVAVSLRQDSSLRFYAADLDERKRTTLVSLKYKREDRWANYIKVAINIFAEMGCPVKGLNFSFCGDIPQQVGLASSQAIEAAAAAALRSLFKAQISDENLSRRLAETHELFFGKDGSPVDYLIAFAARKDQFLLVDEAVCGVTKIKSPLSRYRIIVMDSRVPRMGVEAELNLRRQAIINGLKILSQKHEGASFRDYATSDLLESMGDLPEQIRRKSLHVVQEIQRVYDAADALQRKDLSLLARPLFHSHESLRDLYEVSCPETDWLVKRAQETEGVIGARMTGQGFGGCTYTIIRNDAAEEYKKRLEDYERIFGFRPLIYEVKIATGCRIVPQQRRQGKK